METKLRKKWTAALRSGDYQQGRCYLQRVDEKGQSSYCCLGVLCEVTGLKPREFEQLVESPDKVGLYDFDQNGVVTIGYVPEGYMGLTGVMRLISLNDVERQTFSQIADWIDKNLS